MRCTKGDAKAPRNHAVAGGVEGKAADGDVGATGDNASGAGEDGGVVIGIVPSDVRRGTDIPVLECGVPSSGGAAAGTVTVAGNVNNSAIPENVGGLGSGREDDDREEGNEGG